MTIKDTVDNTGGAGTDQGKADVKVAPDTNADAKMSDVLKQMDPNKVVGLDKFLEIKKENKQMRKDMTALMELVKSGATAKETRDEIAELAKTHDVNPEFLKTLVDTIEKNVSKKFETAKPKAQDSDDDDDDEEDTSSKETAIQSAFTKEFDKAMAKMEDFEDIVDKDTIFALSRLPKNADKTMTQIIEQTYGKTLTGKRTIDSAKPGAGKEAKSIDYKKAAWDGEYLKEILSDPALKKEYNQNLIDRGL